MLCVGDIIWMFFSGYLYLEDLTEGQGILLQFKIFLSGHYIRNLGLADHFSKVMLRLMREVASTWFIYTLDIYKCYIFSTKIMVSQRVRHFNFWAAELNWTEQ